MNFLPSPRYYREIFPIYRGITAVTAELPLSPLLCHSLQYMTRTAGILAYSRLEVLG